MFDDSLEFQLVAPRLAIAHPTGYPLFSILINLFTYLPVGDVAYRVNLASAFFGAVGVALVYSVSRKLIDSRAAAIIASLIIAFGETFWSQAVIAEVYTLHVALSAAMIWLALRWSERLTGAAGGSEQTPVDAQTDKSRPRIAFQVSLTALSFFFGLMLTHHRMSILLFPALAVYVLTYDRGFLRDPRTILRMAIAFALPLLLYLYIPIRGLVTTSLDGTYQNTPSGFLGWVLGSSYNVFLTQNPLGEQREIGFFIDLAQRELTWVGLALAAIGLIALARRKPRECLLIGLAFTANLLFGLTYQVADINVFFIPAFLFTSIMLAAGVDWLARLPANTLTNERLHAPLSAFLLLLSILLPYSLFQGNFQAVDLSGKWDVHDYGVDVLSQNLPRNSTVVGILGEMTLLRYFQETENLRRDVQTVADDKEPSRIAEISSDLANGRVVLLTRRLPGAEAQYSLSSLGPLILVQPAPNTTVPPNSSHRFDQEMSGVRLIGWDLDSSGLGNSADWHLSTGRRLRLVLYWHVETKPADDRFVSVKLLNAQGARGAQVDRHPVLDSYPTTAWRPGEFLSDTYDLPILTGADPGEYELQVTMYNPESGEVHGQANLITVSLDPDTTDRYVRSLDIDTRRQRDFGGLTLLGYSVDSSDPYPAGSTVPITLLWRASTAGVERDLGLRLLNAGDNPVASQEFRLGGASVRVGQYIRQEIGLTVPKSQPKGALTLELDYAPRDYLACELPIFTPCTVLGKVQVKR